MKRACLLLLCVIFAGTVAGPSAMHNTAIAAQIQRSCGTGIVGIRAFGRTGFSLYTGAYTVDFSPSSLLITHRGASGAVRLSLLPGSDELNLLKHVTGRSITRKAGGPQVQLKALTTWATATISLQAYTACPGLLHWTVSLATSAKGPASDSAGTDLTYVDARGKPEANPKITVYTASAPAATGLAYLYDAGLGSTLFYLADLTALNGVFRATNGSAVGGPFRDPRGGPGSLVGTSYTGLGFTLPEGCLTGLPASGPPATVIDSYLLLSAGMPATEVTQAAQFLYTLALMYAQIQKPVLHPANWRSLGFHTAKDLRGPDVLVPFAGHQYLRAYVSDQRQSPELITQLNVLTGVIAYEQTFGHSPDLDRLHSLLLTGLPAFYASEYHSVVNNLPRPHGASGGTESWYYIGDLIGLARVAESDKTARALLMQSIDSAIELAHHVHYDFPRSISYYTWQGSGSPQADVAGGYAYLMLQLFDLTRDNRYLREAEVSINHLTGYGLRLAYETHITALAATAAAHLYTITGNSRYLNLSLLPLANLFAAARLWDCGYGTCSGGYHTFFGLSPLPWSGYIAMMEQEEAWRAVREYALLLGNRAPPSVRTLVSEFYRNSLATLAYTLPPLLPRGVASAIPAEYSFVPRNRLDLYIPLEDLRDGSQPSGQIGQEIYGAGGPLALAGLATSRLAKDIWLTSPYPVALVAGVHGSKLTVFGSPDYRVKIRLEGAGIGRVSAITNVAGKSAPIVLCGTGRCFNADGGEEYVLFFA